MNDIEILEDYVKLCKRTGMDKERALAIENLLKRNKELESDNYECNNIINDYIDTVRKKDKIINDIGKWIEKHTGYDIDETLYKESKEYIIDYFTKKARREEWK